MSTRGDGGTRTSERGLFAVASFDQERCWKLRRVLGAAFDPTAACMHRITGSVDEEALAEAARGVQRAHESLRTVLVPQDADVAQLVLREPVADLERERPPRGLAAAPDEELEAWVQDWIGSVEGSWEWERGPLFRLALVSADDRRHWLAFLASHAIVDGWSLYITAENLGRAYRRALLGEPAAEEKVPQFRDWVAQQRRLLCGGRLEERLAFWRGELGEDSQILETALPLRDARESPADGGSRLLSILVRVDPARLRRFAASRRVSPNTIFLTALFYAAAAVSKKRHFAVTMPYLNRPTAETQRIIGWLSNRLMIPFEAGETSVDGALQRVHQTVLTAMEHGDVPKPVLRRELWDQDHRTAPESTGLYFEMGGAMPSKLELHGAEVAEIPLRQPERMHGGLKAIAWLDPVPRLDVVFNASQFADEVVAKLARRVADFVEELPLEWAPRV